MTDASTAAPAVKICGLTRAADAATAADAGAELLGVVLVPESPRAVEPHRVADIRDGLEARLVLVVADRSPSELADLARQTGAEGIQLHGDESADDVRVLREMGDWTLWKSVRVRGVEDVERTVEDFGDHVDGIHLDGWDPRRIGGTGVRFSWRDVGRIRDHIPPELELVISGGLDPDNVREAVDLLRPDIVDVSSGVEAEPGIKDPEKIRAFIRNAKESNP